MTATTLIETKTLGTAASEIEFTNIPQTYTDLVVLSSLRETTGTSNVFLGYRLTINGSTSISVRMLQGSGTGRGSFTNSAGEFGANISGAGSTSNTFGSHTLYITNYASTTTNKSISYDGVMENNATESYQNIAAGLYASNTAITSLSIRGVDAGGIQRNLAVGSTVSLYGITKGSDGITVVS